MFKRILVANRGEVALRVARAAADVGIEVVAVFAEDDAASAQRLGAALCVPLPGQGPQAYLDIVRLVDIARRSGCRAVHPGWGFLAERADFAAACAEAGLVFVGPTAAQLALFGDKVQARALAQRCGVPVLPGSAGAVTLAQARAFMDEQGAPVMLKALGGGGGRGMRPVHHARDLPEAYARCMSEAQAAFGVAGVYVERLMPQSRHVEVQVAGDGHAVVSLGERECTLQRRQQKLVEMAPSPWLSAAMRQRLVDAARVLTGAVQLRSLATVEFLVDESTAELPFAFIETNARLQVEHTVTEAVTGLDLVQLQLQLAAGATLPALGLDVAPTPRGFAVQWRINAETLDGQGVARPAEGTLGPLSWPSGPGQRVDSAAQAGDVLAPHNHNQQAKLVVHAGGIDFSSVLRRSRRALAECGVGGVATNLPLLQALALRDELESGALHTGFVEQHLPALLQAAAALGGAAAAAPSASDDGSALLAPMAGRLAQWLVEPGQVVTAGSPVAVLEAMKMEHLLTADRNVRIVALHVAEGAQVVGGQRLAAWQAVAPGVELEMAADATSGAAFAPKPGPRADLHALQQRLALTQDAARPEAVARRHALGQRTARENVDDLCDAGSFNEYGALAVAAQRSRRSEEDLQRHTPADGMVTGIASVNAQHFGAEASRTVVLAYDATVLAGTQGMRNHQKTDRLLGLALRNRLPVVLFAEGGGGRPGDTDMPIVAGLHVGTFASFARLSGQVPVLGIAAGRCFAGNAALLGCCDLVIATRSASIGMGGPAMVEGGGLGVFRPEQIGPAVLQARNGVIDVLVDDEAQAVAVARQALGCFQGRLSTWQHAEQAKLRDAVPLNRLRVYDMRAVLQGLFDSGSVLELRAGFGAGMLTALARLEGRAVGVMANNPAHLGGAIDADAADKAARFMQLCNAHGLPLVSLVDTPGFMVGPDAEAQAQVRHVSRLFVTAAALRVPSFSVVLRKGYGLGAMAMAAGGFHEPDFTVAWPTGEFGAMGLEGAVRLGWRKELEAAAPGAERDALFQRLLAQQVAAGGALNMATTLEIDAVIDPADTRDWLLRGLAGARLREERPRFIDPW